MDTPRTRERDDPYDRAIADVLRARKAELRLTEGELATRSGVPKAQINRLFNYRAPFGMGQFMALCDALELQYGGVLSEARTRGRNRAK